MQFTYIIHDTVSMQIMQSQYAVSRNYTQFIFV